MPDFTVSKDGEDVHVEVVLDREEIGPIDELVAVWEALREKVLERILEVASTAWLESDLGPRWGSDNTFEDRACPECSSPKAKRKETRSRTIRTADGDELTVDRPVVTCKDCGREYRPYDEKMGLSEEGHQYTPQALIRAMKQAIQTTYQAAAEWFEEGPSARTIHRYVTELIPSAGSDPNHQPVAVDATQVPQWRDSGQHGVSVAHALESAEDGWDHQPMGWAFGDEVEIKPVLEDLGPSNLVHDGGMELESVAPNPRRCRWHVVRSVKYLLYRDDIRGETNEWLQKQLASLVWDDACDEANYRVQLIHWARRYEAYAPFAAAHVRHAVEGLVRSRRRVLQTTSLVEREMPEINKRFENGGGWTQPGGEAMIAHHQMLRHQPEAWHDQITELVGNTVTPSPQNSVL